MRRISIVCGIGLGALLSLAGCQQAETAALASNASNDAVQTATAVKQAAVSTANATIATASSVANSVVNAAMNPTSVLPLPAPQQPQRIIIDTPTATIIKQNGQTVIVMKPRVD